MRDRCRSPENRTNHPSLHPSPPRLRAQTVRRVALNATGYPIYNGEDEVARRKLMQNARVVKYSVALTAPRRNRLSREVAASSKVTPGGVFLVVTGKGRSPSSNRCAGGGVRARTKEMDEEAAETDSISNPSRPFSKETNNKLQ